MQAVLEERSDSVSAVFPQPLGISVLINDQLMIISEMGSGEGARRCCSCSVPLPQTLRIQPSCSWGLRAHQEQGQALASGFCEFW